jgi:hypothetical protein
MKWVTPDEWQGPTEEIILSEFGTGRAVGLEWMLVHVCILIYDEGIPSLNTTL